MTFAIGKISEASSIKVIFDDVLETIMGNQLEAPIMPPREDARFKPLLAQARTNWEENNPEMVKELQQKGQLQKCLESAVEQAIIILQQCELKGLAPDQARELGYENLFLPSANENE